MFRQLWDKLRRPKNRFSIENLQYLHAVLLRHPTITDANRDLLVETLRQLAEVLIWGDQHNPEFFDFFLEKNLLGFFLNILNQKTAAEVKVCLNWTHVFCVF
jgi:protein CLEC16A